MDKMCILLLISVDKSRQMMITFLLNTSLRFIPHMKYMALAQGKSQYVLVLLWYGTRVGFDVASQQLKKGLKHFYTH